MTGEWAAVVVMLAGGVAIDAWLLLGAIAEARHDRKVDTHFDTLPAWARSTELGDQEWKRF